MTRIQRNTQKQQKSQVALPGQWPLQDAKARFSELVRRVHSEGPQRVTVHGREEVVVIAAEDYRRLQGSQSGSMLVSALQRSPFRDLDLQQPESVSSPVRNVDL